MLLDFAVARAMAQARTLERAVHDHGPWAMQIHGVTVDAVKVRTPSRVVFLADFPDVCWTRPVSEVWLLCNGDQVCSRPITVPQMGNFSISWELGADDESESRSAIG